MKLNRTITAIATLFLWTTVHAATITVSNTNDNGAGSLRNALASVANGDTINFTVTGTVLLTTGELLVSNSVTIAGPGSLALEGNFPNTTNRVFHITNAVTTVISGLTITNGHIISATLPYPGNSAGGIYNDHSTLTLNNCILSGNAANGSGGGIVNNGENGSATLTVSNCTFSGNTGGNGGGGILNDGSEGHVTMRVIASTFTGNSGGSTSLGGGIYNTSFAGTNTSTVIATTFVGNSAGYGGGIYNDRSTLTLSNCVFSDNSATTSSGGAGGGGILNYFGKLTVIDTTLSGNSAAQFGGGIYNDCPSAGLTGIVTLTACTLSDNSATPINGGGNIYNIGVLGSAMLNIGDTLLNEGASASNIVNFGSITSLGYNLSSDNGAGALTNTADQINTNPLLGPLANNGGPTLTCAPLPGSPAIDKGKSFGVTTDQRGFPRTVDDPCVANASGGDGSDIGALETQTACVNLQITAITRETNNIRIIWMTYAGKTNALQWTAGSGGSYATNSFANLFIVTNTVGTTTNFLDVGGATNNPARYYRVRLVP